MADRLSSDLALKYARSLKRIKGFSWDEEVIKATAEDLRKWCVGATIKGRVWCAEAQADWVVTEAAHSWEEWQGANAMHGLFRAKFVPAVRPGNAAVDYGLKPSTSCQACGDSGMLQTRGGYRYCDCELGQTMKKEDWGATLLQKVNQPFLAKSVQRDEGPMPSAEDMERRSAEERRLAAQTVENARAMATSSQATKEQRKSARRLLKRYPRPTNKMSRDGRHEVRGRHGSNDPIPPD
jgi:hypothetical protein